jgi:hypothetical protein
MLSNLEIDDIMIRKKARYYHRCVSKDELVKLSPDPGSYIINMDNSDGPGSHWVSVFIDIERRPYYFDSFGCHEPKEIEEFMKRTKRPIQSNSIQIQNINSSCCGYYCIFFCLFMSHHIGSTHKLEEFIKLFDPVNELKNRNQLIKRLRLLGIFFD